MNERTTVVATVVPGRERRIQRRKRRLWGCAGSYFLISSIISNDGLRSNQQVSPRVLAWGSEDICDPEGVRVVPVWRGEEGGWWGRQSSHRHQTHCTSEIHAPHQDPPDEGVRV